MTRSQSNVTNEELEESFMKFVEDMRQFVWDKVPMEPNTESSFHNPISLRERGEYESLRNER